MEIKRLIEFQSCNWIVILWIHRLSTFEKCLLCLDNIPLIAVEVSMFLNIDTNTETYYILHYIY